MSNEGNTLLKDGIVNGVLRSYDVFVMSWWDIPVGFPDGPSAPPRIHPKHNLTFHSVWQAFRPTRYTKTVTCWARLSRALASPRPWSPWRWRPAPNSFLTAPLAKAMTRSRQKTIFGFTMNHFDRHDSSCSYLSRNHLLSHSFIRFFNLYALINPFIHSVMH